MILVKLSADKILVTLIIYSHIQLYYAILFYSVVCCFKMNHRELVIIEILLY